MTDLPPEDSGSQYDDRALAGELALRVLAPDDETRARRREASDPAFAAEVEAWNEHLAAFADEIRPVRPSPAVWPRVQSGIAPGTLDGAANDNGRVGFWRNWAVGSTGLLAASLVAVAVLVARPTPAPIIQAAPEGGVTRVATLSLESGAPVVTLAYDTVTGHLFIAPTQAMRAGGGVPHLWLVKPEGAGVQLIGAIDGSAASRRTLDAVLVDAAGTAQAVAISLEPAGTTPASDTPGGPVIASGELLAL